MKFVIAVAVVMAVRPQGVMRPYCPALSGITPGGVLVLLPAPPLANGRGVSVGSKFETVGWNTIDASPSGEAVPM